MGIVSLAEWSGYGDAQGEKKLNETESGSGGVGIGVSSPKKLIIALQS